jgi:hypothetical protein
VKFSIILFISFLFLTSILTFLDVFYHLSDEIFNISLYISTILVYISSAMLIIASALQIFNFRKKKPYIFFANPIVLCTIFTFLLPFSLTNFFLYQNEIFIINNYEYTSRLFFIIINSINLMWVGYWLADCINFNKVQLLNNFFNLIILKRDNVKIPYLFIFIICSVCSFLIMNYLNIYGYNSNPEKLVQYRVYNYILYLFLNLHYPVLIIMSFLIFKTQQSITFKISYLLLIIYFLILGLFSGFKSQIFYPFLLIFIIYYICKNKFSLSLVILPVFFVYFSYIPIEHLRKNRDTGINSQENSLKKNYLIYKKFSKENITSEESIIDIFKNKSTKINNRVNSLVDAAKGFEILNKNPELLKNEETPTFLKSILISPITAIIPRFLWKDKPVNIEGGWFAKIIKNYTNGSTGMTSFLYLFFAGGYTMVFLFYFFLGIIQNVFFKILKPGNHLSSTFLFVIILPVISIIDSAIYGIISFFFREFIILLFLQLIIFKVRK